ncbi:AraC family ligand binding domain-containing protein [Actinosynnema pretiosum subsp. pretiosum]|uniref:AraC family ligand binding domain-containing protein n=1 Tax=Actinosynnema pretiosum subsp. pretiosum TaxID=103721 RepID=A0AA45L7D0_9PSEU|nr:Metallo-beta-lactamase superfamily protein [Actinosynnema pretiosum subsp. pretiosum]QUF04671.1 AraC family ligand binding domain-containing protein [Actinosynnema pretiosum subsp. pretiosum]
MSPAPPPGAPAVRQVHYRAGTATSGVEVLSFAELRRRAGPDEWRHAQRPDFDLLLFIRAGEARHWVDFTGYPLQPGDVLWVRSGQVQRWGDIAAIEGAMVLFTTERLDDDLARRSHAAPRRVHWEGVNHPDRELTHALEDLQRATTRPNLPADLRIPLQDHGLARLIIELLATDDIVSTPARPATDEAHQWFVDELERRFRELRKVSDYASRLGFPDLAGFTKYFTGHTGTSPTAFRAALP